MTGMPEVSPAWHFATSSASAWQYFASADWANAVTGKVSAKQAINNLVAEVMIDPPHVMTAPRGPDLATHDVARFDHRQGSFDIRRSTVLGAALAVLVGHWV
jgi:hypothetical protein